jgi:hypothetical protein
MFRVDQCADKFNAGNSVDRPHVVDPEPHAGRIVQLTQPERATEIKLTGLDSLICFVAGGCR